MCHYSQIARGSEAGVTRLPDARVLRICRRLCVDSVR
jgi:hypothetical protein